MSVWIAAVLAGATWVVGYLSGWTHHRIASRQRHEHIWGVWEHCHLTKGRPDVLVKGQFRDCLACGAREVRQVMG